MTAAPGDPPPELQVCALVREAVGWVRLVVVGDLRARLPWPLLSSATPPDLPVRSAAVLPLLVPAGTPTDPADPPVRPAGTRPGGAHRRS